MAGTSHVLVSLDEFVAINNLDDCTAESLRRKAEADPAAVQEIITELGQITGARNNNAIVMKRLRSGPSPYAPAAHQRPNLDPPPTTAGYGGAGGTTVSDPGMSRSMQTLVNNFADANGLDETTRSKLLALGLNAAAKIAAELGVIQGARNNNAIVMARVKKEQALAGPDFTFRSPATARPPPQIPMPRQTPIQADGAVGDFIRNNGLDERTEAELLQLDPEEQNLIMGELWNIHGARNPNAIVMAEIRKCRTTKQQSASSIPATLPLQDQIAHFVTLNGLDESAEGMLRSMDQRSCAALIQTMGHMEGVRNPSAVVSTEIRRQRQAARSMTQPQQLAAPRYHPYGAAAPGMMPSAGYGASMGRGAGRGDFISNFVLSNGLDQTTEAALRMLSAAQAVQIVTELGQITGARNPNAIVMVRIKRGMPQGRAAM
eukprot:TRINITY_DN50961_c0_g1_i1.p1 TRINITY_DN50961_c0_g1~~TRINITY_DN50961_c0_g1_i1.p1  ORF type:complete len:463 (+),score=135.87 TRINITY_DN50961_c0_g1_i1:95-1390(+)